MRIYNGLLATAAFALAACSTREPADGSTSSAMYAADDAGCCGCESTTAPNAVVQDDSARYAATVANAANTVSIDIANQDDDTTTLSVAVNGQPYFVASSDPSTQDMYFGVSAASLAAGDQDALALASQSAGALGADVLSALQNAAPSDPTIANAAGYLAYVQRVGPNDATLTAMIVGLGKGLPKIPKPKPPQNIYACYAAAYAWAGIQQAICDRCRGKLKVDCEDDLRVRLAEKLQACRDKYPDAGNPNPPPPTAEAGVAEAGPKETMQ